MTLLPTFMVPNQPAYLPLALTQPLPTTIGLPQLTPFTAMFMQHQCRESELYSKLPSAPLAPIICKVCADIDLHNCHLITKEADANNYFTSQ